MKWNQKGEMKKWQYTYSDVFTHLTGNVLARFTQSYEKKHTLSNFLNIFFNKLSGIQ